MLPEKILTVKAWFAKAEKDIRSARHSLTATPPFTDDALFHSQQAVEKALKGFLVWHDRPFRKTHDLRELSGEALKIDSSLAPMLQQASLLTPYAVIFRYPGESVDPPIEEANESIAIAEKLYLGILAKIPKEVHPSAS